MHSLLSLEASRGAGAQAGGLWVRFPLENMKYSIFSFPRSGVEIKRGVEFRHSIHNASRIRRKVRSGVS